MNRKTADDFSPRHAEPTDAAAGIGRATLVVAAVCAIALISYFVHVMEINVPL